MPSARSLAAFWTLILFGLLISSCGFGDLVAQEPTITPTRTRRPTATATDTDTPIPTNTATPLATATFTAVPPTATFTAAPPTDTPPPPPPTNTATRRPPTATFTPAPPNKTPPPPPPDFPVTFNWINQGIPFTKNQCTFPNGTHIEGKVMRGDGSLMINQRAAAVMHLWIKGFNTAPFGYPGAYKDFPSEQDGRWNAEFPKLPNDFEWHIFISVQQSDDPVSADMWGVASGTQDGTEEGKCGKPGTKNWFVADWVVH